MKESSLNLNVTIFKRNTLQFADQSLRREKMFKRAQNEKHEVRQVESGSQVVKTTVTRRDGVTETTTMTATEVLETSDTGARGMSQTVTTSHSSSSHSSVAQKHRKLLANFEQLSLKSDASKSSTKEADDKEKSSKGGFKPKIGAILGRLGGRRISSSDCEDNGDNDASSFANQCLNAHNEKRKIHDVQHLKLSKKLNEYANKWAETLAREDSFRHSDGEYGENIYMKWSSNPNHVITGEDPVNSWYDEIKLHEFGKEPSSLSSGHFTQVIWKESTELGVARARSNSGKLIVVASYFPAGNMRGSYVENVPPPRHHHH